MNEHMRPLRFLVVGGMNMDILGHPDRGFAQKDSNIGKVQMKPGGVGRNIAEQLALTGAKTYLITPVGNDTFSETLKRSCQDKGIDLSRSLSCTGSSPVYLAIHDAQGDMTAAVNDMALLDKLTPKAVKECLEDLPSVDAAVIDANLAQSTLAAVLESASFPVLADPVSNEKALRLLPVLPFLTAIKPNRMEAEAMTGEASPEAAARKLLDIGVKQVYISLGTEGVWFADQNESGHLPATRIAPAYLTGAGDAMCAGITVAMAQGKPAAVCAWEGQQQAAEYLKKISKEMES